MLKLTNGPLVSAVGGFVMWSKRFQGVRQKRLNLCCPRRLFPLKTCRNSYPKHKNTYTMPEACRLMPMQSILYLGNWTKRKVLLFWAFIRSIILRLLGTSFKKNNKKTLVKLGFVLFGFLVFKEHIVCYLSINRLDKDWWTLSSCYEILHLIYRKVMRNYMLDLFSLFFDWSIVFNYL